MPADLCVKVMDICLEGDSVFVSLYFFTVELQLFSLPAFTKQRCFFNKQLSLSSRDTLFFCSLFSGTNEERNKVIDKSFCTPLCSLSIPLKDHFD